MDIDILLALQEFRNSLGSLGDGLTAFFLKMTFWGELTTALVITAVVYWCVSKDFGTYLLMGWNGSRLANGLIKVTACVYRPWIRDARVVPVEKAVASATGYSFPSGHSMNGTSVFGGVAIRKDLPKALRIASGIIVVLIAFSRPFLGVHTPQDVIVGVCAGLLMMWLSGKLMTWIAAHPEKDILVAAIGMALGIALAVFASVKSYPMDYDADGKLLVDGAKMANDTFQAAGWGFGFFIGWVLERRFVRFSTEVPRVQKLTRLLIGLLGFYVVTLILGALIKGWLPGAAGTTVSSFLQMFYVVFLFPWCLVRFEKGEQAEPARVA